MATGRNHTKGELLAQLEQQRIQNQLLAANLRDEESRHREAREQLEYTQNHLGEARALLESSQLNLELANERIRELTEERDEARFELRLARQRPQRGRNTRQIGIPMELRAAFFRDTGKTSATAKEIREWEGNL